jgi:hypothetical protein
MMSGARGLDARLAREKVEEHLLQTRWAEAGDGLTEVARSELRHHADGIESAEGLSLGGGGEARLELAFVGLEGGVVELAVVS